MDKTKFLTSLFASSSEYVVRKSERRSAVSHGTSKTAAQLVAEARQRVEHLTPDQVAAEVAQGNALLVDLRESEERAQQGTIPGAVHAPRGMLEFYADPGSPYHRPEFDPQRRVILHCASGGRSALAADTLRQLGYTDVAHLDGGLKAWCEAGRPTEGEQAPS
jgi:rhodanese-related sulfurtransferase